MAGTDTTTTFLRWAVLLLSVHPQIQTKVHEEIDSILGQIHSVRMKDKLNLPYTDATIMEIHRFASVSPISLPHSNTEKIVSYQRYFIPKGSSVFQNVYAVHRDETYWKHANEFNPENFLNENGDVVHNDHLIPFSIGKYTHCAYGEFCYNCFVYNVFLTGFSAPIVRNNVKLHLLIGWNYLLPIDPI